jgi:hypothetical protein
MRLFIKLDLCWAIRSPGALGSQDNAPRNALKENYYAIGARIIKGNFSMERTMALEAKMRGVINGLQKCQIQISFKFGLIWD